jgi:hypothetical protein
MNDDRAPTTWALYVHHWREPVTLCPRDDTQHAHTAVMGGAAESVIASAVHVRSVGDPHDSDEDLVVAQLREVARAHEVAGLGQHCPGHRR